MAHLISQHPDGSVTSASGPWKANSKQGRNTRELAKKTQSLRVLGTLWCSQESEEDRAQTEVPSLQRKWKECTILLLPVVHSTNCPAVS